MKHVIWALTALIFAVGYYSCSDSLDPQGSKHTSDTGTLAVGADLENLPAQGLNSELSSAQEVHEDIATGEVVLTRGSHSVKKHLSIADNAASVSFYGLEEGLWTMTTTFYDARKNILYQGQNQVEILAREITVATISLSGNGTISVVINLPILYNPAGLLVWNKLDDSFSVKNSEVGPNLIQKGSPSFSHAKFGNGVQSKNPANGVRIPLSISPNFGDRSLTFEFWFKPNYGFGNTHVNRMDHRSSRKITWLISTHKKAYGSTKKHDGIQLGVRNVGFQKRKGTDISAAFMLEGKVVSAYVVPGSVVRWQPGDLVHFAYVYDKDASAFYIYINGELHAKGVNLPTGSVEIKIASLGFALGTLWRNSEGVIDNLKVWDHAKTNFDLINE